MHNPIKAIACRTTPIFRLLARTHQGTQAVHIIADYTYRKGRFRPKNGTSLLDQLEVDNVLFETSDELGAHTTRIWCMKPNLHDTQANPKTQKEPETDICQDTVRQICIE